MFLDEAIVTFSSGRGGSGAVAFHTEKHVPRGGPKLRRDRLGASCNGDLLLKACSGHQKIENRMNDGREPGYHGSS